MRVLGVDWGGTRIGLAMGEKDFKIASPRPAIKASGSLKKDAEAIANSAKAEDAVLIVVGVPYHEVDDRAARVCLQLVDRLREIGVEVRTVDESLTTEASHADLAEIGLTAAQRKRQVDGESARRILLRYFEEHG